MWPSIRSSQVRNARHILAKINHPPHGHRPPPHPHLHFLQTPLALTRRILLHCFRCLHIRLRSHSPNLRLRRQFPYPKVSPSPEHRGPQRHHIRRHPRVPRPGHVGGGVLPGLGATRRFVDVEFYVVGRGGGTIRVYTDEQSV